VLYLLLVDSYKYIIYYLGLSVLTAEQAIMDALLSLPLFGYFLMPSLTTYSTSLNLLFFYMVCQTVSLEWQTITNTFQTWSTLVLSQPPLRVEIVGMIGVRALFFLAPSLLFLLFDSVIPSLAVGLKAQGAPALPTRTGGVKGARKAGGKPKWYSVLGLSLFNICLSIALQAGVELLFTQVLGIRSALKITTTLPMPWSIARDVIRSLVLREVSLIDLCSQDTIDENLDSPILYTPLYPPSSIAEFLQQEAPVVLPRRYRTLLFRGPL
jgi:hypothetical protein